jgi:hypothetical protein
MLRRCEGGPFLIFHHKLPGVDDHKRAERRIMRADALRSSVALLKDSIHR